MTTQTPIPPADRRRSSGEYLLPAVSLAFAVAYLVVGQRINALDLRDNGHLRSGRHHVGPRRFRRGGRSRR
ncbi:MAG: hypothetical protein ACR2LE_09130 [Nocardioidaceae bacterium]